MYTCLVLPIGTNEANNPSIVSPGTNACAKISPIHVETTSGWTDVRFAVILWVNERPVL